MNSCRIYLFNHSLQESETAARHTRCVQSRCWPTGGARRSAVCSQSWWVIQRERHVQTELTGPVWHGLGTLSAAGRGVQRFQPDIYMAQMAWRQTGLKWLELSVNGGVLSLSCSLTSGALSFISQHLWFIFLSTACFWPQIWITMETQQQLFQVAVHGADQPTSNTYIIIIINK